MRYAFNNQLKYVYLYQEMMWLEQYLYLQEICMEGKLSFDISMDDEIVMWPFRKMLLQPFVENSIIHGIKPKGEGNILISAVRYEGNRLRIMIGDNGCGMDGDMLERMRRRLLHPQEEREQGIGLSNVASRIYYFFGETAVIRIYSEKGKGTRIVLILPYPENTGDDLDKPKEENEEREEDWNEIY